MNDIDADRDIHMARFYIPRFAPRFLTYPAHVVDALNVAIGSQAGDPRGWESVIAQLEKLHRGASERVLLILIRSKWDMVREEAVRHANVTDRVRMAVRLGR